MGQDKQQDNEFEAGNRQHAGQEQGGGNARLGDSLSGSIGTEGQQEDRASGQSDAERDGNLQRAGQEGEGRQSAHDRAMPTVPDEEPRQLSEEELRLMADTMPGEGPGDD